MKFLSTALFASGALAVALRRGDECLRVHAIEMGDDAKCGNSLHIAACLAQLTRSEAADIAQCYRDAGCSESQATSKSFDAHNRCEEAFSPQEDESSPELRRRSRGELENGDLAPLTPPAAPLSYPTPLIENPNFIFARGESGSDACYDTKTEDTTSCDVQTNNGKPSTITCTPAEATKSVCKEGKTCSFDNSGTPICMDLKTQLDLGGIIVACIFGVGIVASIGAITFLCCRDRREQKRLKAKAEATALARAATKKKKAQEQRTPLMADRNASGASGAPGGGANPFHDGARS